MKKFILLAAFGVAGMMSAKSADVEKVVDDVAFCMQIRVVTSCGLDQNISYCPENGDHFQCVINEADMIEYWNCQH